MTYSTYLDTIIWQIKNNAAVFGGRVVGAASYEIDFEKAETVDLDLPAAYVVPLGEIAAPNVEMAGEAQLVTQTIRVVVASDSSADPRGQAAITQHESICWMLKKALCHFVVDPDRCLPAGIEYLKWNVFGLDRARLWVYYDFSFDYWLTDPDAFQPIGDPITEIVVSLEDTSVTASVVMDITNIS